MLPSRQRVSLLALGLLLGMWSAPALAQTAGCGLPAAPGVSTVTLWVNGVQRSYVLSVPSTYHPTIPVRRIRAGGDFCIPQCPPVLAVRRSNVLGPGSHGAGHRVLRCHARATG